MAVKHHDGSIGDRDHHGMDHMGSRHRHRLHGIVGDPPRFSLLGVSGDGRF